jgi:uncharacterized protein
MSSLHTQLLEIQDLDNELMAAQARLDEFTPRLDALEDPIRALEAEKRATEERLEKLRHEVRKLEHGATQKRERLKNYEDRLGRVRAIKDEGTIKMELDLIRRAIAADEQEHRDLGEQATRTDLKIDDLTRQIERKKVEQAPLREELQRERDGVVEIMEKLSARRGDLASRVDKPALRIYERIRSGRGRRGLAPLTDEGACGQCFNILPVQEQELVKQGDVLHRCEACGIILYLA